MKLKILFLFLVLPLVVLGFLLIPVNPQESLRQGVARNAALHTDLSSFPATSPVKPVDLLFIHHSCGGQLLAEPGPDSHTNAIYTTSPNAGGLRALLEKNSYVVHEASYGSAVGEHTDLFDWLPKFRDQMQDVLAVDSQDRRLPDGRRNRVVVFKSCYPNNAFVAEGASPGNPAGPELTLWNAKASFTALLEEFKKHPDVLFICVTAPPLAPKQPKQALWKVLAKKALGRYRNPADSAAVARQFNDWLASPDGWLENSSLTNVAVFNYYDILTGCGASDVSIYATGNGMDSHPSAEGNGKAAEEFVPFLNRALHRAGLQH